MVTIIAEAGVAHCGSIDKAHELVDAAKKAGADIVKFQTFAVERLLRRGHPEWETLEELQLSRIEFLGLAHHCEDAGIEFCSTPGDVDSLKFLVESCGVRRIKIGSDDLTYDPLIEAAQAAALPVILSTGMATLAEIHRALTPWVGKPHKQGDVTLLHCVSLYPCPLTKVNLGTMDEMRRIFGIPVGYSDHAPGTIACVAAAAMGAVMIEKHISLYDLPNPDGCVSAYPDSFARMVNDIRAIEMMRGHGRKEPWPEELEAAKMLRKGQDGLRP